MSDNVEFQHFPFSAKSWLGKNTLRLAIIVNDKPISLTIALSMGILYTSAYAQ